MIVFSLISTAYWPRPARAGIPWGDVRNHTAGGDGMPDQSHPSTVEVLDQTLTDAGTEGGNRRWLLERAAVGAASLTAVAALGPAAALAGPRGSSIAEFGTVAVTTEALTVTLLAELLRRVNLNPSVPAAVKSVFEGAYAAEVDHFRFTRQHWRPTTTMFWIPGAFFGGPGNAVDLTSVGKALVAGETLFVRCDRVLAQTPAQCIPAQRRRVRDLLDRDPSRDRDRAQPSGRRLRCPGRGTRRVLQACPSDHDPAGRDRRQPANLIDRRVARADRRRVPAAARGARSRIRSM